MHAVKISIPEETISKIVRCVEYAVGDDIREDIQRNDLQTHNSLPSRIWDLLNTNIIKTISTSECTIAKAHRGPWEMLVVFENTSQCIITFMREKRFAEIQKKQRKRSKMHYVDMLAKQFNSELLSDYTQLSIIPEPHKFSDDDKLSELIRTMLAELSGDVDVVRNHILVLFDTTGFNLTHIRAVMVTPTLEIASGCDENWSRFISGYESVVEKVSNPIAPENQPNRGLKLTPKAIARKKNKPEYKNTEESIKKA